MRSKKFLSIVCALIMMFAISVAVVDAKPVSAAENKSYYGTTLLTTESGSPTITSSLEKGAKVTFNKSNSSASIGYKHTLYTKDLQITFNSSSTNFEELWFKLAEADNDTKWVKVTLKKVDGKIQYKLEDNNNNKTEYADSGISVDNFANDIKLSLKDGSFKLNNTTLASGSVETLSFYKNMAKMSYGVNGVDSEGSDAVVCITKINDQTLVSSNNSPVRVDPVIISKTDGQDDEVKIASPISASVNAAENTEYTFNYYCLDVLGTGWAVAVDAGAKVSGKTSVSIGAEDSTTNVKIYPTIDSTDAIITLAITAIKDTKAVKIDKEDLLLDYITKGNNKLADAIKVGHIVATTAGNTFEFPRINKQTYEEYVQEAGETVDTFDSVKIQVGYKAPGDNGDYTYASSYAVKLNEAGVWYFVYKFTDIAGNETVTKSFSLRVLDETKPEISVSEKVDIIVNEKYTIPSATITDNASGVDSRYTVWTLYKADENGNKVGNAITNFKNGEEGYDESELKDGVLTPTEVGAKYVIVYEARDNAGNIADSKTTVLTVVEGTPDYAENPFNNFVKGALITVACLAGLGIIILIFVQPKERRLK